MKRGIHIRELDISIGNVWEFVSDPCKWAPLVPGYVEHEIFNETQSMWKLKGEIGVVHKTVLVQIDITEWRAPNKISFTLTGLNENFTGNGYFEAKALTSTKTKMTGSMSIVAKGLMGPMLNSLLKTVVPKTTKYLTEAISNEIMNNEVVKVRA